MFAVFALLLFWLVTLIGSAYLYWKFDWKALFIFIALICGAVIITGNVLNIPVLSMPFILGGIGGATFKKDKSFEFYLLTTTAAVAVLTAGFFYYSLFVNNVDFLGMQREIINKSLEAAQVPDDIREQFHNAFNVTKYVVPFGIVANSIMFSAVSYIVIKNFLIRIFKARPVAGLEFFRLNEYFIFLLIAGLAVYLLIDREVYSVLHIAGLNLVLIAVLFYIAQGLAVIKYFLIHRGLPTYIIPLAFIGLLLMGFAGLWAVLFISVLLAGFGALDIWADFRKLSEKTEKKGTKEQ